MALWLLAGPFDIQNLPEGHPVWKGFEEWYPGVGLVFTGDLGKLGVVTLDGIYESKANGGSMKSWWPDKQQMVGLHPVGEVTWEPKAFLQQTTGPDNADISIPAYANYVRLSDRRIYYSSGDLVGLVDGVATVEGPHLPFYTGGGVQGVHAGRTNGEILVTGKIVGGPDEVVAVFYDTMAQELSSPYMYLGMDCSRLTFAPEFGVLVSCHVSEWEYDHPEDAKYSIRIWSLEVQPTVLSTIAVALGPVKSGQVVTYQVRVLGSHNDPAENERVEWSVSGAGTVLDYQTVTDANGYATTKVQYLVDETGESVVTAAVVC